MLFTRTGKALLAAAVAVTVAAVPVAADAKPKPPKPFANDTITIQKSIGGVTLGDTIAQTNKKLHRKFCSSNGSCTYTASNNSYSVSCILAAASAHATPRIARITLDANSPKAAADALHTSRGIGLGSTVKQVKKAYPSAKSNKYAVYFGDPNNKGTAFYITKGRVSGIFMQSEHIG